MAEKTIIQEGFKDRMTLNKASKSATMLAIDFTEPEKGEGISWVPTWTRSASNPQTWTVPLAISPVNWPTVENGDDSTRASLTAVTAIAMESAIISLAPVKKQKEQGHQKSTEQK